MGDGTNPSGSHVEDMVLHVRQPMFVKFQGAKDNEGAIHSSKEAAKKLAKKMEEDAPVPTPAPIEDDMPADHFFSGHLAFACSFWFTGLRQSFFVLLLS